jgi:hypothetical protein
MLRARIAERSGHHVVATLPARNAPQWRGPPLHSHLEPDAAIGYRRRMISSLRMLAGTVMLLVFIIVYVLVAMVVASAALPNANFVVQFVFYAVAGLAWVPAAGWIVSWMHKGPARSGAVRNP